MKIRILQTMISGLPPLSSALGLGCRMLTYVASMGDFEVQRDTNAHVQLMPGPYLDLVPSTGHLTFGSAMARRIAALCKQVQLRF